MFYFDSVCFQNSFPLLPKIADQTTPRLARAIRELRHLETEIEQFYRTTRLSDSLVGLRNAVRASIIITLAAWGNKHSMGTHYRE
jgi:L-aspartate oxidase